jgi:hypothetical protein
MMSSGIAAAVGNVAAAWHKHSHVVDVSSEAQSLSLQTAADIMVVIMQKVANTILVHMNV